MPFTPFLNPKLSLQVCVLKKPERLPILSKSQNLPRELGRGQCVPSTPFTHMTVIPRKTGVFEIFARFYSRLNPRPGQLVPPELLYREETLLLNVLKAKLAPISSGNMRMGFGLQRNDVEQHLLTTSSFNRCDRNRGIERESVCAVLLCML